MLKVSNKQNWWTSGKDKNQISDETKIEYILNSGSLEEIKNSAKLFGIKKLEEIYQKRLAKNIYINKKRHLLLSFFFDENRL